MLTLNWVLKKNVRPSWLLIGWRALVIRWKDLLGAPVWLEPYVMGKVLGQ